MHGCRWVRLGVVPNPGGRKGWVGTKVDGERDGNSGRHGHCREHEARKGRLGDGSARSVRNNELNAVRRYKHGVHSVLHHAC